MRFIYCICLLVIVFVFSCSLPEDNSVSEKSTEQSIYLNHHDTAAYVGMQQCRLCHQQIYDSFIQTGMGMSFDKASRKKSSADFSEHPVLYDKYSDFYYHPFWHNDTFKIKEYRLGKNDTVYKNIQSVDYIIGSGQHTNSHLISINGYLYQAPLTYYTQKQQWDLPPGFEAGRNTRFTRKIGIECMSCHNSFPEFIQGSENKYNHIPNGINCERCHGPGSIHVQQKTAGIIVDTAKHIDYSIVNPGKLSVDLQFDVCQRCHLQGNTVLKENKSFYDFKPGMKLSDVMTVFLPRYNNSEQDFIMASHADRLKMSKCFIASEGTNASKEALRPYKNSLTCVTCHNPHVSVKATNRDKFNAACNKCHEKNNETKCSEKESIRIAKNNNCISCHMPRSGSSDIPHVNITDHFIRKPLVVSEEKGIKKFLSLYAVNEKKPSPVTLAKGYLNQYEKFEAERIYLDSAKKYLEAKEQNVEQNFRELIHLYYLRDEKEHILKWLKVIGKEKILNKILVNKAWDNYDAWTCYRIGQTLSSIGDNLGAEAFYKQAVLLAPLISEFKNKLATTYLAQQNEELAFKLFNEIIIEEPVFAPAYSNLGYWYLLNGKPDEAMKNYNKALAIDPDYEQALLNKAGLYIYQKQYAKAKELVSIILKRNPNNAIAKDLKLKLSVM